LHAAYSSDEIQQEQINMQTHDIPQQTIAAIAMTSYGASLKGPDLTEFRVWAPNASRVDVLINGSEILPMMHLADGSIADFKIGLPIADAPSQSPNGFVLGFSPQHSEGSTSINGATTYFRNNGPTNFSISSDFGADQFTHFSVDFARATQGNFAYTTQYSSRIYFSTGWQSFSGTITGLLSEGTMDPVLAGGLDSIGGYHEFVYPLVPTYIGPNHVPEPGSMALLAVEPCR
jgi:hypothetical protein